MAAPRWRRWLSTSAPSLAAQADKHGGLQGGDVEGKGTDGCREVTVTSSATFLP